MHSVVFPPPEGPTIATFSPAWICRFRFVNTLLWSSGYSKLTFSKEISPFGSFSSTASGSSKISISASTICKNRSMPVIPLWNCSANSMIRRIVAISVDTYSIYATRSPAAILPLTMKMPPATSTTRYISPSNSLTVVLNAAM